MQTVAARSTLSFNICHILRQYHHFLLVSYKLWLICDKGARVFWNHRSGTHWYLRQPCYIQVIVWSLRRYFFGCFHFQSTHWLTWRDLRRHQSRLHLHQGRYYAAFPELISSNCHFLYFVQSHLRCFNELAYKSFFGVPYFPFQNRSRA